MVLIKKKYTEKDKIFRTQSLKWEALCNDIIQYLNKKYIVLTITYFDQSFKTLTNHLNNHSMEYIQIEADWKTLHLNLKTIKASRTNHILLYNKSIQLSVNPHADISKKEKVCFLMAEHYPIYESDGCIYSFAQSLACTSEVIFYTALDELIIKASGGEKMMPFIEMFGFKNGCIDHPLITQSIKQAQKKIKHESIGDQKVNSAQAWFYYNCPNLGKTI